MTITTDSWVASWGTALGLLIGSELPRELLGTELPSVGEPAF